MDIEAKRKLYNRYWNESAFSGGDMDNLLDEIERLSEVLKDIRDNWDCDSDAHKYGTSCRRCLADKALEE